MATSFQSKLSLNKRLVICSITSLLVLLAHHFGAFTSLEFIFQDTRTRLIGYQQSPPADIVVIEINDASFERMQDSVGNWPWPRSIFSAVLQQCEEAKAVAFDIFFSETDQRIRRGDQSLADEAAAQNNVISALYLNKHQLNAAQQQSLLSFRLEKPWPAPEGLPAYEGALLPFPSLLDASAGIGHANYQTDKDGVIRNYLLAANLGEQLIPSIALATAQLSNPDLQIKNQQLRMGSKSIALDPHGNLRFCPYLKDIQHGYFTTYNIADVLRSWNQQAQGQTPSIPKGTFKDKIVLIGSTAQGLQADRKVTSFDSTTPGVFIHATVIANLLEGKSLRVPSSFQTTLLIIIMGMLPGLLKFGRSSRVFISVGLLIAVAYNIVLLVGLYTSSLLFPVAAPMAALIFSLFTLSILNWNSELAEKRSLQNLDAAKQQFTDMLVHDLKGGIATMMMSLEMLQMKSKSDAPKERLLVDSLLSSSSRINTQISALLDIRKIEEGQMSLDLKTARLHDLINECLGHFKTSSDLLNIKIVLRTTKDVTPYLSVDHDIFIRILTNLLWNALQHGSSGKDIVISTKSCGAEQVAIAIANEGKVIPQDQQENLFQPFVALAQAERQNQMVSTGLGLAFCKLAVEAHHGSITLQSPWPESGNGVEFTLKFPAHLASNP